MSDRADSSLTGKLLAEGFARTGPVATALSDPIADTPSRNDRRGRAAQLVPSPQSGLHRRRKYSSTRRRGSRGWRGQ